ncbi:MAG TPA: PAS domain S-box protein [Nitrospiraceae bacterium]|nr:PAS domain S-box protein [Nitrospiraceae bacterium]
MNTQTKEWTLRGMLLLLLAGLFVLDIRTPLSFANHILYATAVLMATASRVRWMPALTAGVGSVLTVAGGFLSPGFPDLPVWIPAGNRAFTILILWVLVWFAMKRRLAEAALQKANEGLEEKIAERTHELAEVNQALVSEITERMQTEQAFRLSEGRLAGILDIAEDAIIVIDEQRTIALFNQGAVKLFGYDPDEILGQSLDRLLPERLRVDHSRHIQTFAHSAESARRMAQRRDVFGLKKDGTEFPAEASISKLTVGQETTFTVILRDITDRLRTEHQLHSLATQLMTAQEEERRRISRELHDDINQRLALLAFEMGRMETGSSVSADAARQAFQSLAQRLAAISDDVRRMAYQFHPSILDDLGLSAALNHLANEFSVNTGIKTVVVQEDFGDLLPQEVASCLYRIAQESLANVTKHARASRVELELTCDGQEVTLSVHDSGVGFDLERIRAHHLGLGLVNMRERVRSVHGRLEIQAQPGQGTHIIVQIPLPGARHEPPASPVGR